LNINYKVFEILSENDEFNEKIQEPKQIMTVPHLWKPLLVLIPHKVRTYYPCSRIYQICQTKYFLIVFRKVDKSLFLWTFFQYECKYHQTHIAQSHEYRKSKFKCKKSWVRILFALKSNMKYLVESMES
jgi:hypothetical protein